MLRKKAAAAFTGDKVVSITTYRNRDLIETLENLLAKAKSGEVTGLIYAARVADSDHGIGVCGAYAQNPLQGLTAMSLVANTLHNEITTR